MSSPGPRAPHGFEPQGSLDAEGRLDLDAPTEAEPAPAEAFVPPPPEVPLELAEHVRRRPADFVPEGFAALPARPERRGRHFGWLALLACALLATAAGVRVYRTSPEQLDRLIEKPQAALTRVLGSGAAGIVTVTSEPAGAELRIDGQVLGTTPWAGDNSWQGEVAVELRRTGYRTWKGTLQGAKDARIDARLVRRR